MTSLVAAASAVLAVCGAIISGAAPCRAVAVVRKEEVGSARRQVRQHEEVDDDAEGTAWLSAVLGAKASEWDRTATQCRNQSADQGALIDQTTDAAQDAAPTPQVLVEHLTALQALESGDPFDDGPIERFYSTGLLEDAPLRQRPGSRSAAARSGAWEQHAELVELGAEMPSEGGDDSEDDGLGADPRTKLTQVECKNPGDNATCRFKNLYFRDNTFFACVLTEDMASFPQQTLTVKVLHKFVGPWRFVLQGYDTLEHFRATWRVYRPTLHHNLSLIYSAIWHQNIGHALWECQRTRSCEFLPGSAVGQVPLSYRHTGELRAGCLQTLHE